jgi:hypothetical protein
LCGEGKKMKLEIQNEIEGIIPNIFIASFLGAMEIASKGLSIEYIPPEEMGCNDGVKSSGVQWEGLYWAQSIPKLIASITEQVANSLVSKLKDSLGDNTVYWTLSKLSVKKVCQTIGEKVCEEDLVWYEIAYCKGGCRG